MHRLVSERSPWATCIQNDRIDDITIQDFNNPFNRFTVLLRSREDIARWLMKEGLLADKAVCDRCQTDCRLSVRERTIDGLVWRCSARHEVSVRRYSFFRHVTRDPLHDRSAKREIILRCMIDVLCHYAIKYALTLFGETTCNPWRGLILDNAMTSH